MEAQTIINVAIGLIAFLGGWVMKNIQDSMKSLQKADLDLTAKVQAIEVLVAGTYVKRDDLEKMSNAIFVKLDKIDAKLDSKMSRDDCERMHPK
jgi:hypothetical protein